MRYFQLLFFLLCIAVSAQELEKVDEIQVQIDKFIGFDTYGNAYVVKNQVLSKIGLETKVSGLSFNDYLLGSISSVDIVNPLKIVVFYKDLNTVVLLDNKLNEIERINFNELPQLINVGWATNAGTNQLWIFNLDTRELELFNYRTLKTISVSQPFSGELIDLDSNFNYCYTLTDSKLRIHNIYGSLLYEGEHEGFKQIAQQNDRLIAATSNDLFLISTLDDEAKYSVEPIKKPLSENTIKDLQLTQDFLYIYDGLTIQVFTLTQPKQ